jgi:putative FmdB family regulatory protein
MPTYEYKCEACGHEFERFQPITSKPIRKCPKCGRSKVKRLLGTGAGLIFKGSGFYITDYRSEQYKSAAKAEGASSDKPAEKSETKPATEKPAAKTKSDPATAPAKKDSKPGASPPK